MDIKKTQSHSGTSSNATCGDEEFSDEFSELYKEVLEEFVEAASPYIENANVAMEIWRQNRIAEERECEECGRVFIPGGRRAPAPRKCAECKIRRHNSRRWDRKKRAHFFKNRGAGD